MSAMVTSRDVTLSQDFPCRTDFQKDFIPDFISFHKGLLSGIIRQSDSTYRILHYTALTPSEVRYGIKLG